MAAFLRIAVGLLVGASTLYLAYVGSRRSKLEPQGQGAAGTAPNTTCCVLCLKHFENFSKKVFLSCRHPIHPQCALLLLEQKETNCPMCRKRL